MIERELIGEHGIARFMSSITFFVFRNLKLNLMVVALSLFSSDMRQPFYRTHKSFTEQARTGMQGETAKARLRPRMRRPPSLTHAKPLLLDSASFGGEEAEEDR